MYLFISSLKPIDWLRNFSEEKDEVFINPIQVKDGSYITPQSYGWGLEMHKEFLRMYEYPIGDIWKDRVASGSITFLP